MQPYKLTKQRACQEDSPLTAAELTGFTAVLGALLWLCHTRLDIICDVVLSQQYTHSATIKHLKLANAIVTRAKKYASECGLYFPVLDTPFKLVTVADSSHAT